MLTWLTAQSIVVIALFVLAGCYLLSAAIITVVAVATSRGYGPAFKAVVQQTLSPLGVVFGLTTAFLAADVWPNFERAQTALAEEAMGLREAVIVAQALPPDMRVALRDHIQEHIDFAVREEWPAMAKRRQTLERPAVLSEVVVKLLSTSPSTHGTRLAQQQALAAVKAALDARQQRILLSQTSVGGTKVCVLVLLASLVLGTIAMVHADNRRAQVITVAMFATAVACSLLVILVYDRPFSGGGISQSPAILLEVRPK